MNVAHLPASTNISALYVTDGAAPPFTRPLIQWPRPQAGFPSPAADYVESPLDLNAFLVKNKAATFYARVQGNSMLGAGIQDGDIVSIDRSIDPVPGKIVIAVVDGDLLIKWLRLRDGRLALISDHPTIDYPPRFFDEAQDSSVWGVVTGLVRKF